MHTVAWFVATSAAIGLTWFGVHTALSGTAYDPPRALPISTQDSSAPPPSREPPSSPSRTAPPSSRPPSPSRPASPPERRTPTPPGKPSKPAYAKESPGNVRSYSVEGGRVAFDLGPSSATLVSATPEPGWEMKVWEQPTWIRVDFHRGDLTWSVFCVWNGHPPIVDTYRDQR